MANPNEPPRPDFAHVLAELATALAEVATATRQAMNGVPAPQTTPSSPANPYREACHLLVRAAYKGVSTQHYECRFCGAVNDAAVIPHHNHDCVMLAVRELLGREAAWRDV